MRKFFLTLLVLAVIALIPLTGFFSYQTFSAADETDLSRGMKKLQSLDSVTLQQVQQKLDIIEQKKQEALEKAERLQKTEALIDRLRNGKTTYRKVLKDLYIAGDSLMAGLQVYNILNPSHIFAEVSASLSHLEENFDAIAKLHPPILLLHYGLNMISSEDYMLDNFIRRYTSLIRQLQQALPNTRIVVSLLFPVDTSVATAKRFRRIGAYNKALQEMCQSLGVQALDSKPAFSGRTDFYGSDGIHLSASFYRNYWLTHVMRELEIGA